MEGVISPDVRQIIKNILISSGFSYRNSNKLKGTVVVDGDLVANLIDNYEILDLVDNGILNIWSHKYKEHIYTFIQSHPDVKPRYRNFGDFFHFQQISIQTLKNFANQKEQINESFKHLYPWKYKYNLKNFDEYYYTPDWFNIRNQFYSMPNMFVLFCPCCEQEYDKEGKILLNLHHKITIKNGGSNSFSNLISICSACHSLVHSDKYILIESLMVFFAITSKVGYDKLRNALVNNYSHNSVNNLLLDIYDQFVKNFSFKSVKLFFFQKLLESVRFSKYYSLMQNSYFYFKINDYESAYYSNNDWSHSNFKSGMFLYDLSAYLFVMFFSQDKIKKYNNNPKKNAPSYLKSLDSKLQFYKNQFITFLNSSSFTPEVIFDLYLVVKQKIEYQPSPFNDVSIYSSPTITSSLSLYEQALLKRNKILNCFLSIFYTTNLDISDDYKLFYDLLNDCVTQLDLEFFKKEANVLISNYLDKINNELSAFLDYGNNNLPF